MNRRKERRAAKSSGTSRAKSTTKMEFVLNQRGEVPLSVVAEYATPEETASNARKAIRLFKDICKEENLSLGDQPF